MVVQELAVSRQRGAQASQSASSTSNLYELGANDKIVQRVLRHAKPHGTRERYIKAFDPAVLAAMKQMESALDLVAKRLPTAFQVN
jgi:hypothetical protein